MVEIVFALLMIVDHEIKEHLHMDSLSKCLKGKRNRGETVKKLKVECSINALNLKLTPRYIWERKKFFH